MASIKCYYFKTGQKSGQISFSKLTIYLTFFCCSNKGLGRFLFYCRILFGEVLGILFKVKWSFNEDNFVQRNHFMIRVQRFLQVLQSKAQVNESQ